MTDPLRIGTLGAAHMAVVALVRPARSVPDITVAAVAARDPRRAERWARRHDVPRVYPDYAALLADPAIDAVYIPLPNSLHAPWTMAALQAGKHVLCEKPLAANAAEAAAVAEAARASGRVVLEAMHYRYHPLAARLRAIVDEGTIGALRRAEVEFSAPLLQPRSIQFRYDLGGGAAMDVGCYVVDLVRYLFGAEPQVVRATATLMRPDVDRLMRADLALPNGATARITCSLLSARLLRLSARFEGTTGRLRVVMPWLPHLFNLVTVTTAAGTRYERVPGGATYRYQLEAFAAAIRSGKPGPRALSEAVATQRVVDDLYRAAGLRLRGHTNAPAEE